MGMFSNLFWKSGSDPAEATAGTSLAMPVSEALREIAENAASVSADEDTAMIEVFIRVVEDNPEGARDMVRDMSPKDRAVLSFYAHRVLEIVSTEDDLSSARDRRAARLSFTAEDEDNRPGVSLVPPRTRDTAV